MNRFTKISAAGAALPEDSTEFVAVLDTTTGLMWPAADLQLEGDAQFGHSEAMKACAELDLAGFKDWRAPTVDELFAIADRTRYNPAADPLLSMASEWYWSSTPAAYSPESDAWYVLFSYGYAYWPRRYGYARVRAVRVASQ